MKPERFRRTKGAVASSAIALVVAALVFGLSSLVIGPRGVASPGFGLTASSSSFTITSNVYDSPACSGPVAPLLPGLIRCNVFTVKNNLSVPITVQNISTTMTSPPAGCPASFFSLPTFTGSLSVPGGGTANTPGVSISLLETGTNQDACAGVTFNFAYSGNAQFTDATTTGLTASTSTQTAGQAVTLSAPVTGANAATDPSLPTGTVTFNSCPTSACSTSTALGTGTIGSGGTATMATASLSAGVHYLQAVYGGQGTDYTGSTSPVLTLTVAAASGSGSGSGSGNSTGSNGTGSNGTGSNGTAGSSSGQPTAFTGADIAGMTVLGLILISSGTILVIAVRRRRRTVES